MTSVYSPEHLRTTTDEVLGKLLTLDTAREQLAPTEGLAEYEFITDGTQRIHFEFPDNWADGLDAENDFFVTDATMEIDGTELPLTKVGALELTSEIGLPKASAIDTPGNIVQDYLNYHYMHGARGKLLKKVLASDLGVLSIVRGTITPFSNLSLLDAIVAGIGEQYNTDDLRVDYKLSHNLQTTNLRLIVPSATRTIGSARAERAGDDPWSLGIELCNSVDGHTPLELKGYLFAWWCTNGCTVEHASSGKFRRKSSATPADAYDWAQHVVEDVFRDLRPELDAIEQLTQIPLEGELNETVGRTFERFGVPDSAREAIINNLVESDDLTAYGLLNSVTAAANAPDLKPTTATRLLNIGGELAHVLSNRCDTCHRFG